MKGDSLDSAFRAMNVWLESNGIESKSITVVLRTTDEINRLRLNAALNRWSKELTIFEPSNISIINAAPFECYGIKVNVSSLDGSR